MVKYFALPQTSKVVDFDCIEGQTFTAKWTGVKLSDIFNKTGAMSNATTVIFYCADGYSTSLDMSYILQNNIMVANKDNDVRYHPTEGFLFSS